MDASVCIRDRLAAVVFDCDGVLLDSNLIKVRAFKDAVLGLGFHPLDADAFEVFVKANFGTSRFKMFEALLAREDLRIYPDVTVDSLVDAYAENLTTSYRKCAETEGMQKVLQSLKQRGIPLYVVSGSVENELRELFIARDLMRFFDGVFGSPTGKSVHLNKIINSLGIRDSQDIVFVGDAEADWKAAVQTDTSFIYMSRYSTATTRMSALKKEKAFPEINTLEQLEDLIFTKIFEPKNT